MKILFRHNQHTILVTRGLASAELTIDDKACDVVNGFSKTQMSAFELNGEAKNPDGTADSVKVEIKIGIPSDTVTLYYNGMAIETQKTVW